MTTAEKLQLVSATISACGLTVAAISAFFAVRSLRSTHDWNRRKAAQDATLLFNSRVIGRDLLERELGYLSSQEPIPLDALNEKFKNEPNLKAAVHSLLNYFEMLARGVNQNIYDEVVVRTAWKGAMQRAIERFGPYIRSRKGYSSNAWKELQGLAAQWTSQDLHSGRRAPTG
jgi:hypothetical protein